jgi:hypothetical protein
MSGTGIAALLHRNRFVGRRVGMTGPTRGIVCEGSSHPAPSLRTTSASARTAADMSKPECGPLSIHNGAAGLGHHSPGRSVLASTAAEYTTGQAVNVDGMLMN